MHQSTFVPSDSALYSVNADLHSIVLNAFIFRRILLLFPLPRSPGGSIHSKTSSLPAFTVFELMGHLDKSVKPFASPPYTAVARYFPPYSCRSDKMRKEAGQRERLRKRSVNGKQFTNLRNTGLLMLTDRFKPQYRHVICAEDYAVTKRTSL